MKNICAVLYLKWNQRNIHVLQHALYAFLVFIDDSDVCHTAIHLHDELSWISYFSTSWFMLCAYVNGLKLLWSLINLSAWQSPHLNVKYSKDCLVVDFDVCWNRTDGKMASKMKVKKSTVHKKKYHPYWLHYSHNPHSVEECLERTKAPAILINDWFWLAFIIGDSH